MKVGIIGCAHMQTEVYTGIFLDEGIQVTGVYDRNHVTGLNFAQKMNITYYDNIEEILLSEIDTVLICSENSLHYDYTLAAAYHKKHVIIEKPLALNTSDAIRMILVCREHNVKLMVAHPLRFSPTILELKKIYQTGELGKILCINGTNHGKNPGGWFLNKELAGGGAIIDHMIHLIDLTKWLFEFEIDSIYTMKHASTYSDIEDSGLIHINFTNEVFMSLDTSWNRPLNFPIWGDATLEIITDRGQVIVDGIGRKSDLFIRDSSQEFTLFEKSMDVEMIQSFIECVKNDLPEPVTGYDGLYTVKIASLAYESAKQDRIIYQSEFKDILKKETT
ncbi:hypothetical protein IGI37_002182 [Enterococcus sp. AZ194]|uniref:Gfo/Idh/MocA family protein n=1 Tax=Enterococcus sp. AZ194 TaxID=2774629 RepID=UPI003F25952C